MKYSYTKNRGVHYHSIPLTKLFFQRDASYGAVLQKCCQRFWPDAADAPEHDAEYYLADGGGASIEAADLDIVLSNGGVSTVPWTLQNYLRATGLKFPSRARLYCVQKMVTGERIIILKLLIKNHTS